MGRRTAKAAVEEAFTPPDSLTEGQYLVRVVKPEGNNLYACELPSKKPVLLELAQRFRNTVWIRKGGFVLAQRYEGDAEAAVRAEGEIVNVVRNDKLWKKQPYWPAEFLKSAYDMSDSEEESTVGKMPPSDSDSEN